MGNVYYSCDWHTQFDKVDVDLLFEKLNQYKCELSILEGSRDKQGNQILRIGIRASSEAECQGMIQEVGHRYGATSWHSMTATEFVTGKQIDGSEENRNHVYGSIQAIVGHDAPSYELHRKLDDESYSFEIYTADWLIERRSNPSVYDLFSQAESMNFPLTYAYVEDDQGFLYLRFFAIVESFKTVKDFIALTASSMGLAKWEKVTRENLPNILRFDPRRAGQTNLVSKWGESIGYSATHNQKLTGTK